MSEETFTLTKNQIENISDEVLEDMKYFMTYTKPVKGGKIGRYVVSETKIGSLRYFIDKAIRRRSE